ncbi:MAG: DNA-directed polymerase PolC, partial [Phycisphaerales bacterium]|nr:DNA-directed polymerase PolC [Phycisphaerales bacterium]
MPENENEKPYLGTTMDPPKEVAACAHRYAELDVTTHYSFLRGASFPSDLVYTAANLGYHAMAITDRNSLAGVVRAFEAAKKVAGFCLIVGVRLVFVDGTPDLLAWPGDCDAYARLCRLLTRGKRAASKGECHLTLADFLDHNDGIYASLDATPSSSLSTIDTLQDAMGDRLSLSL